MSARAPARRSVKVGLAATLALAFALAPGVARAQAFSYAPPGELTPGSGTGRADSTVFAPGLRFPIEGAPAYLNSQVWGNGGGNGPGGSQCDAVNFSYPWRDNYCEKRSWDMPLCPAGTGHQGQDIRAASCKKDTHWAVAVADGTITNVGSYSVYLTAGDGTRFDYLHMSNVQVGVGKPVSKGQRLGLVSNQFGGAATTVHLHFNVRQNVAGVGTVYVPPYMSLIKSYEALVGPVNASPKGQLDSAGCDGFRGWAFDPDAGASPIAVHLYLDSVPGQAGAQALVVVADGARGDLCGVLGSCDHGFAPEMPYALGDGAPHAIHAFAINDAPGDNPPLGGSPRELVCALALPDGVRRAVDVETSAAWGFDPLWDVLTTPEATFAPLPEGDALGLARRLVQADGEGKVYLVDGEVRRHVPDPTAAALWHLDLATVEVLPAAEVAAWREGPPLRHRPLVVQSTEGAPRWLLDDPIADESTVDAAGSGSVATGHSATGAGAGSGGGGGGATSAGGASPDDDGDASTIQGRCACRAAGGGGSTSAGAGALVGAGALALGRRRRRAREKSTCS